LLAHGRWFSPDTPVSSTTKAGRHDIAEILLKVALSTNIKSSQTKYITIWNKLSLRREKWSSFMQSLTKITYIISHNLFKMLMWLKRFFSISYQCFLHFFFTNFKYLQIMSKLYSNTLSSSYNKINKQYHTIGTIPWSNIKMVEIGKIDNIQLHDRSLSCHGTGTLIKYSGVNQFDGPKPTIAMK
jgi:hypothetical protein